MQFNTPTGKAILSLVRQGDYAHPGEEEAIDLLFSSLPKDPDRSILDLGCGRGGTAAYVQRHGWGRVTGVDIDADSLRYAAGRYPGVSFLSEDVARIAERWRSEFDLIYLYNSFYAFPDQKGALEQIWQVSRPGATLAIFEYTDRQGTFRKYASEQNAFWKPVQPGRFPAQLKATGWELERVDDLTPQYFAWYRELCSRIKANKARITRDFGKEWYELARDTYEELLGLIEQGVVGGSVFWAKRA